MTTRHKEMAIVAVLVLTAIAGAQQLEPWTEVKPLPKYQTAPSYAGNNSIPPNHMIVNGRAVPYPVNTPTVIGSNGGIIIPATRTSFPKTLSGG